MSEAKPAFAPTYEEAVKLAAPYYRAMAESDMALAAVGCADPLAATADAYRYRLRERENLRCASEAWAVQKMVSALFGVSEEQVDSDVRRAAGIED
ncbi:hypothetical protein [uncultured Senegalimassilia sp.]|mgnify:CR=1 FL=1|uniref:hypothetical protein n=1 Tax=uncultured Senegalimassilia sp. TaxID=1714350 RepID=UPI0027DE5E34|nr:hypothetical protein [uncultured Senegalimassilia sp.]